MMNPEIKKKWCEALRSGEYEQGTLSLRHGNTYCCLGVLCDLHSRETGNKWDEDDEYLDKWGYLPSAVMEWSGFKSCRPEVRSGTLDRLNDTGTSFSKIAGLIEKEL